MPVPETRPQSVWATGQLGARGQRGDRYVAASREHPAKMLPAIARHAVAVYSQPGDTVLDPLCGIGTSLVEALELGRHVIGVDTEPPWVGCAAENVELTKRRRPELSSLSTMVIRGDARHLPNAIPASLHGGIDLVVTSPPYGARTHGLVTTDKKHKVKPVSKTHHQYRPSTQSGIEQIASASLPQLRDNLTAIFVGCHQVMRMGGHLVATARGWIDHGHPVDFASVVIAAATDAGLVSVERCAALTAAWTGEHLLPRHTFFALHNTRAARNKGRRAHLNVFEDVLVFAKAPATAIADSEAVP